MLHRTSPASKIVVVSQPAMSAGSHTSCGRSPNSWASHGGMLTGNQPMLATRNSPEIPPRPIIDRKTVAIAMSRSQRITAGIVQRTTGLAGGTGHVAAETARHAVGTPRLAAAPPRLAAATPRLAAATTRLAAATTRLGAATTRLAAATTRPDAN